MTVDVEQLSCRELVELVTDYLEGALSPVDTARFEDHIGRCGACTIYLEQMRQTVEVLGHLPVDSVKPEAKRDLLEAFRGWRSS
jgi:predicted anti-sigma-YlaC factor YlaD